MEDEAGKLIPQANFELGELAGIERLLWAYGHYVQKIALSAQDRQRVQAVETIRGRLIAQLTATGSKDVQLFLDRKDLEILLHALLTFAGLIERFFPKNEGRDMVIESVTVWRLRLSHIMGEFDVT